MRDTIRSAYDPEHEREVHIDGAARGGRYKGIPRTYHQDCLLYPRFPSRKQSSFAHIPCEAYCPEGRGESSEHRESKRAWVGFLEDQLSGCFICAMEGRDAKPDHFCPPINISGEAVPVIPSCHGVLWFCESCDQPHLYKLLRDARDVKEEWWTPGRTARIDIVLLDDDGNPVALIEIKRKHLSDRPFEYAEKHDIPLFVVDVSLGVNAQPPLHNNRQSAFVQWPDLSVFPPRSFDFLRYDLNGISLACGTDGKGRLAWRIEYEDPDDGHYRTPHPAIGPFILASEATVSCEKVREEALSGVFISEGESPDDTIDWRDW